MAAKRPVDVQVYLRDVPGGDQGLLLHFLRENWGGGAGIRDTDPDLSPAAVLGREPWGHHGSVSCRNLLPSPGAPKAPGPAASPDPLAGPKHSVAAERPVDVQVYLRDVLGGDQGLLLHFLWENRGGGAGIRDTDPDLSGAAVLGWEPWGNHGSVSCRNLLPSSGRPGKVGVPTVPVELCEGLCPAVVGREVTEGQPGWDGIGVQPRWEGTLGCCAQDCESEKPLQS